MDDLGVPPFKETPKLVGFSMAMLDEKDDRRKMTTRDLTFRKDQSWGMEILQEKKAKWPQFWLQCCAFQQSELDLTKIRCNPIFCGEKLTGLRSFLTSPHNDCYNRARCNPIFCSGLTAEKDPSRSVETSIKFHSAVVDSFARCFHWDRGLSGDRDMKLKFGYHSYTVHICCNYLHIDTDGYGYICSNVGVCIYNVRYIYILTIWYLYQIQKGIQMKHPWKSKPNS